MVKINSQEFTEAYRDKNNLNIIKYVTKKFGSQLDYDTLIDCGMIGLWNCMFYHDETKSKFTTNLYRFVMWECRRALKKLEKEKKRSQQFQKINFNSVGFCEINVDEYLENLQHEEKEIVIQHAIYAKPFTIIAKDLGIKLSKVKKIYKSVIEKLKTDLC